jgi:hypothetical protein
MNIEEFVTKLGPYMEILQGLGFVATIVLTGVSIYALQQLRIAKDSLEIQSLRDAKKLSTEHIYRFLDRVINNDDYAITLNKEDQLLLKSFKYSETDNETDNLNIDAIKEVDASIKLDSKKDREKYVSSVKKVMSKFWDFLNELEAFAAVVTSGVLDDETVYRAVGSAYVTMVKDYNLDQFVTYYSSQKADYVNVLELYDLWNARLVVEESEKQLKQVENDNLEVTARIADLKEVIKKIQPKTIESIGVEVKDKKRR